MTPESRDCLKMAIVTHVSIFTTRDDTNVSLSFFFYGCNSSSTSSKSKTTTKHLRRGATSPPEAPPALAEWRRHPPGFAGWRCECPSLLARASLPGARQALLALGTCPLSLASSHLLHSLRARMHPRPVISLVARPLEPAYASGCSRKTRICHNILVD